MRRHRHLRGSLAGTVGVALTMSWALGHAAAAPNAAASATAETIGALPLTIDGELAPTWRARLEQRLHEGLARGSRRVLELTEAAPCDATCMRALAAESGARWLIRSRVRVLGRDFDVALELVDARSGAVVTRSASTCEVCAVDEVGDMLADRAGVLDRKLDALARAPAVVRFESKPDAAVLRLDGELLGAAPLERSIADGRHRVRAELRGHLPFELQFDAIAGTRETVTLELSPTPRARRGLSVAGWTALGGGLAALVVGVPLLVLHDRPYRGRCSGGDVDRDGDCRFRYDTRTGGAIAVAVGAAAIATGIALLVRARRPRRAQRGVSKAPMLGGVPQQLPR